MKECLRIYIILSRVFLKQLTLCLNHVISEAADLLFKSRVFPKQLTLCLNHLFFLKQLICCLNHMFFRSSWLYFYITCFSEAADSMFKSRVFPKQLTIIFNSHVFPKTVDSLLKWSLSCSSTEYVHCTLTPINVQFHLFKEHINVLIQMSI